MIENNFQTKYKDRTPQETVQIVKSFFENRNYEIKELLNFKTEALTWTCRIEIYKNGIYILGANGKGMSEEYSLASGYAELYERFANNCNYLRNINFMRKYCELSYKDKGYYMHPDEKILSYDEVMSVNSINSMLSPMLSSKREFIEPVLNAITNDIMIGVPYININGNVDDVKYYDPRILLRVLGSVGMVAGNTTEEALNQGLSEVFEKYVDDKFFIEKVDHWYEYDKNAITNPALKEKINAIQSAGFDIKFFDLSYNFDVPVVMSMLINPIQTNICVDFGAFPIFDIGIERVITELYQGVTSYQTHNPNIQVPYKTMDPMNIINNFGNSITDATFVNEKLLTSTILVQEPNPEVYTLKPGSNNKEILQYFIDLAEKLGISIYYKDNSLIDDMKALHIFCPDLEFGKYKGLQYTNTSNLLKKDWIIHILRLRKQIEEILENPNAVMEDLFTRHNTLIQDTMFENYDGAFVGTLTFSDWLDVLDHPNEYILFSLGDLDRMSDGDVNQTNLSNCLHTIYFKGLKLLETLKIYISCGNYSLEELQNFFALFDVEVTEELIANINNPLYLFEHYYVKPIREYYNSDTYEEVVRSFMK